MMCVECGRDAQQLVEGACAACLAARQDLVTAPESIGLEVCVHCLAQRVGTHWHDLPPGEDIAWLRQQAARGALRLHEAVDAVRVDWDEEEEDPRNHRVRFHITGSVAGEPVTLEPVVRVRTRRSACDRCSRRAGGYWASILQVRATEREVGPREVRTAHRAVAQALDAAAEAGNRSAFLQREGPEHGGWDYYMGDIEAGRQAARLVAHRLGAKLQETAKLVGRREGEDVHRVTFLVRIPLLAAGDVVETRDGELLHVQRAVRGRVQGIRLRDGRSTKYRESDLSRVGGPELWEEAVVVFADAQNVQVIDPETQRAVDLPRPAGFAAEGTVPVLRHREELWLAPPDASNSS